MARHTVMPFCQLRSFRAAAAMLPVLVLGCASSSDPPGAGVGGAGGAPTGGASSLNSGGTLNAGGLTGTGGSVGGGGAGGSGSPGDAGPSDAGDASADADPDAGDAGDALRVRTLSGWVHGKEQFGVRCFLGIPYGAPPTGARRFAPPVPAPSWAGTREAADYGPSCVQLREGIDGPIDEDCLSLNVFTPAHTPPSGAPVMVYVHGGGFGFGGSRGFPSEWLAGPKGVVIVTINYRLGRLGFLTTPELDAALGAPSGNLGMKDQQLALRWVRENAAAFGGDASRVTVFGQSAGAISACLHLFMEGSAPLVDGIIMQSGSCVPQEWVVRPRKQAQDAGRALVSQWCPFAPDPIACLRSLPASVFAPTTLVSAAVTVDVASGPHVDGSLFPAPPSDLLRRGKFHKVPFIGGSNLREPAYYQLLALPPAVNRLEFTFQLMAYTPDHWQKLNEHYMPATDGEANEALMRALTDDLNRCPTRYLAREAAGHSARNYLYSFEIPPSGHAQELDYVFGWPGGPLSSAYGDQAPLPPYPHVIDGVQTYWTEFARTGDPNAPGRFKWPSYDAMTDSHLVIAQHFAGASRLAEADCDWWEETFVR